ncbi:MAG TPA: hypothetical protein VKX17_02270 [Planctomycetota bacterium]|nr:hypothetical protein [Planctomycetota bacterium]
MATVPRRGRFQIHLSTAIVLMFVAGGLMWANLVEGRVDGRAAYGWPFCAVRPWYGAAWTDKNGFKFNVPTSYTYDERLLAFDLSIAFLILVGVYAFCEWLIRRRAARKGD